MIIRPSVKIQEKLGGQIPTAFKPARIPTQPPLLTGNVIQAALDTKGMTKAQLADHAEKRSCTEESCQKRMAGIALTSLLKSFSIIGLVKL